MATMLGSSPVAIFLLAPLAIAAFSFLLSFFYLGPHKGKQRFLVELPLLGMVPSALLNLHRVHEWLTGALAERGCTFRFAGPPLSGMSYIFTSDPAVVKHVTGTKFSNYVRGPHFREILAPIGDGIVTADFDEWTTRRWLAHDLLHRREFLQSMRKLTGEKLERGLLPLLSHVAGLEGGKNTVDLQDVFQRLTFDVICFLVYGVDMGSLSPSLPEVPFAKAVDTVEEVLVFRYAVPMVCWRFLKWMRMGPERKLADAMDYLDGFVYQLIASKKEELSKNAGAIEGADAAAPADDLLTSFIKYQMTEETGKYMSDKFLRDSSGELMMGGRDTTSTSLAWFFWLLSTHPAVEAKILAELDSIVETSGRLRRQKEKDEFVVFSAEDLEGCVYLVAALRECLRLFPVVPVTHKCAVEEDVLPTGEKVEPGTVILESMYAMGRMEKVWGKDCREFKPERWILGHGKQLREESSYKFSAFGSGPRICVGKSLGLAQIKLVSAAVIYNFHFQVAEGHQVSPCNSAILHIKNGLWGSLQRRRH